MEKISRFSAILMASLMAIVACNKVSEIEKPVENTSSDVLSLTVNAVSPETKAVFGEKAAGSYPVTWSAAGEAIKLVEIYTPGAGDATFAAYTSSGYTLSNANATASFTTNVTAKADEGTYDYRAIYPASAYSNTALNYSDLDLVIPGTQTPTATSPDPSAILLYAGVSGLTAQPTDALNLAFSHITAYGKMTIKNAGSVIGGGETIQSVSVSVPAGGIYYYWTSGNTNSNNATKTNAVVINTDNLDTSGDFDVWFACKPVSMAVDDVLTVSVTTDTKSYARKITLTSALTFTAGQVSKFGVDMASATPIIYSTAFNYPIVGSSYTGASPVQGTDAGGTSWYITYGNWNNSNCAQLRVYSAGNFGAIYNDFDCSGVTRVEYDAFVSNTALKLNTYYSTDSGANWTKVDDSKTLTTESTRYTFNVSATGEYPKVRIKFEVAGTKPASSNYQLTIDNVEIYGNGSIILEPAITADNISGVSVAGGVFDTGTYAIHNFSGAADDVTVTDVDGSIVTSASVTSSGHFTYTVAPNYGTSSRSSGTITLTSAGKGVNKVISVSQEGETFSVSGTTITIPKDASTNTFTITTPTFGWTATANAADGKNLTISGDTSGSGNASAQTITVSSTTDPTGEEQTLGTIVVYRNGNESDSQKKTITIKKASTAVASSYTKVTTISSGTFLFCEPTSSKVISSYSSNKLLVTDVTISGETTITGNGTIDTYVLTVTADGEGYYTIQLGSNYIGYSSASSPGTKFVTAASASTDRFKWSISIDSGTGRATIANKDVTDRMFGFNGSTDFRAYQNPDASNMPVLFKLN